MLAVLESFVFSVCEDIAFDMHRAAKTGELTLEDLQKPAFPSLSLEWSDGAQINEVRQRYAHRHFMNQSYQPTPQP